MNYHGISARTSRAFSSEGLTSEEIFALISRAIEEDLDGGDDVTSVATINVTHRSSAEFRNRVSGVVAGIDVAIAVMEMVGLENIESGARDGDLLKPDTAFLRVEGSTREILLAERTSLNFLCHLSGIATLTRDWVETVSGFSTRIRDTRKTTAGFRKLEKYAVRVGGGINHRMSLRESALIKDNHVAAAGGVSEAFAKVRSAYPDIEIEVEVDTLAQLKEIAPFKPDLVLLDNMSVADCAQAVDIVGGRFPLEASGGITINTARAYAETGVNYLAVGALTHSAKILDIGLDLKAEI